MLYVQVRGSLSQLTSTPSDLDRPPLSPFYRLDCSKVSAIPASHLTAFAICPVWAAPRALLGPTAQSPVSSLQTRQHISLACPTASAPLKTHLRGNHRSNTNPHRHLVFRATHNINPTVLRHQVGLEGPYQVRPRLGRRLEPQAQVSTRVLRWHIPTHLQPASLRLTRGQVQMPSVGLSHLTVTLCVLCLHQAPNRMELQMRLRRASLKAVQEAAHRHLRNKDNPG